jgi:hypothetical protein
VTGPVKEMNKSMILHSLVESKKLLHQPGRFLRASNFMDAKACIDAAKDEANKAESRIRDITFQVRP